jgi:hypothetical protein
MILVVVYLTHLLVVSMAIITLAKFKMVIFVVIGLVLIVVLFKGHYDPVILKKIATANTGVVI